jgi:hypothetical protein
VHLAGGDERLDRDAALRVLLEQRVEDESLIASAILSGCPSVTDSDVNRRRDTVLLGRIAASGIDQRA